MKCFQMRLNINALDGCGDVVQVGFHIGGSCEFAGTFLLSKILDRDALDVLIVHDLILSPFVFQYSSFDTDFEGPHVNFFDQQEPIPGANGVTVGDFWQWAYSDILSNRNRSIFAEYIVGVALGQRSEISLRKEKLP